MTTQKEKWIMPVGDGIRRNIASVSLAERNRLRDAIIALNQRFYPGGRSDTPVGGVSYWFKLDEIHAHTHVHVCPAFLPWHRELIDRFEALLREVDPMLSLHYWDWTSDPNWMFTSAFMGNPNGNAGDPWLSAGFYVPGANPYRSDNEFDPSNNPFDPPQDLTRTVGTGAPNTLAEDTAIIGAVDFPSMRSLLEGAHDNAHGFIGGTIGDVHTAFRDPFVFLLHSDVDRLFATWQKQPGLSWRLDPNQVYGAESNTQGSGDVRSGLPQWGILSPLEPWAGANAQTLATGIIANVQATRPWAPPENEEIYKDSRHPTVVSPRDYDTFARVHLPTKNSSFMTQGRFGQMGNFELVVPLESGGLAHFWRNNDDPSLPWNGPYSFGSSDAYDAVSLFQSNFTSAGNGAGNLEVVALTGNRLDFYWRDDNLPFAWHGPYTLEIGISGTPALFQGNFDVMGNFELVVPLESGGLAHYWRNNEDPSLPWNGPDPFGSSDTYDSVALIQSNFSSSGTGPGNLEVVALTGTHLDFYWRDDAAPFNWHGPFSIESGVIGNPTFIQSRFGLVGNFEMVVPQETGGIAHYWRNNDDPSLPWSGPYSFGSSDTYDTVTLVQSNFSSSGFGPGNLEVVAQSGNRLDFYWREDDALFDWHGPFTIAHV
jgi:Common central domain of tyrosinase